MVEDAKADDLARRRPSVPLILVGGGHGIPIMAAVIIFLATSSAVAGSITDLDEKFGFRDAKFGMHTHQIPSLKCDAETYEGWDEQRLEGYQRCQRSSERLNIGSTKLSGITYYFLNDRLVKIAFYPDIVDDERLRDLFFSMWGDPSESIRGPAASIGPGMTVRLRHLWRGKRVQAELWYAGAGLPFWAGAISSIEFIEYRRSLQAKRSAEEQRQLKKDGSDF